jgi:hypothetical protein
MSPTAMMFLASELDLVACCMQAMLGRWTTASVFGFAAVLFFVVGWLRTRDMEGE